MYSLPVSPALRFAKREAERYRKIGDLDGEKMIWYRSRVSIKRTTLAERSRKSFPEVRNKRLYRGAVYVIKR